MHHGDAIPAQRNRCAAAGRRQRVLSMVLTAAVALAASCSAESTVETTVGVDYIDGRLLDVHAPPGPDDGPTVVLLHGAGLDREAYGEYASRVAAAGATVFNADWDVLSASNEGALQQIACAVRYARAHARDFGGDPERLVLVGHSTAAAYVGRVAFDGDAFRGTCDIDASALPTALAVLAPASIPGGQPWHPSLFGGNPELRIAVVHGADDDVAPPSRGERTAEVLAEAGYEVTLDVVPGGHYDLALVDGPDEAEPAPDAGAAAESSIAIVLGLVDG